MLMMRKLAVLALAMTVLLTGCVSRETKNSAQLTEQQTGTPATVSIFQYKVEIADALKQMKLDFEKEHPQIRLDIETVGGGTDYFQALRTRKAAGKLPDLFNNGGYSVRDEWINDLEDLSDQPWVEDLVDVAREPMTKDGKLYGMPLALEGYGFIYNQELFEKAGIKTVPATRDELEKAAVQLQKAGIQPFVNGYAEWWVTGLHSANIPVAYTKDPDATIRGLNDGRLTFDRIPEYRDWIKLLDLTVKYGGKDSLLTNYNDSVTAFAEGKAAMIQQGNWTTAQILGYNPSIRMGFLPLAINNDRTAMDRLPVGVPMNWVINRNSPVKEQAKVFLNWLVQSDTGRKYMTEAFKFIPAFKSVSAKPEALGALSMNIIEYSRAGKTISWNWYKYPGGESPSHGFAEAINQYIDGKYTEDQLLKSFGSTWNDQLQLEGRKTGAE